MNKENNIIDMFNISKNIYHDKISIVYKNEKLNYADLDFKSNQLANFLLLQGVCKNSPVGICLPRSINMIVAMLAILKLGAYYVSLAINAPNNYLHNIISCSKIKLLLTERLDILCDKLISINENIETIKTYSLISPNISLSPEDIAYIMYTSGSTGLPKGVIIPHRSVVSLVKNTNYVDITQEDTFLQLSPFEFDGSTFEIFGALLNGAKLVLMPAGYPILSEISNQLDKNNVSILFITTQLFNSMVDNRIESLLPIKQIFFGGESASIKHVKKFLDRKMDSTKIANIYGPTECTTFSLFYPFTNLNFGNTIPIGKIINTTEIIVVDEKYVPVKPGEQGELLIGGQGVAIGYLNDVNATNENFISLSYQDLISRRFFKTGDIVELLIDGNLSFIGRKDRLIKTRGYRISLASIETELLKYPDIDSAAVDYIENDSNDKIILAWIQPKSINFDLKEFKSILAQNLPTYMIPNVIYIVDNIPLNDNGKINYHSLINFEINDDIFNKYKINLLQKELLRSWHKELQINNISIHDDFFDLGGHSLKLINILDAFHKNKLFKILNSLKITDLFEYTTIQSLCEFLNKKYLNQKEFI